MKIKNKLIGFKKNLFTKKTAYGVLRTFFSIMVLLLLVIATTLLGSLGLGGVFSNLANDKNKINDVTKAEKLMSLSSNLPKRECSLPSGSLINFNFEKDTLPFKNISSKSSEGGVCLGISLLEKMNYMGKLNSIKFNINEKEIAFDERIDFSNLKLTSEEVKKLYPVRGGNQFLCLEEGEFLNDSIDSIYDFTVKDNTVYDFGNIISDSFKSKTLNMINYMQVNFDKVADSINIKPYRYAEPLEASRFITLKLLRKIKLLDEIDVNIITNKINNNEPVVIGVSNSKKGHAILGYKYEYLDKNTLKVYVHDSNIPYMSGEDLNDRQQLNNKEIIENVCIIFNRETNKDKWGFIYNPKFNNNYLYKGGWNNFIPGNRLMIY